MSNSICFADLSDTGGIYEIDLDDSTLRELLPQGVAMHADTREILTHYYDSVLQMTVGVTPPGVTISHCGFDYGDVSGDLYVLLRLKINEGNPTWRFSADSIAVPEWMRSRIREMYNDGNAEWVDLVRVHHNGDVEALRLEDWIEYQGFAVSPNEKLIAYSNLKELRIYDPATDETFIPKLPDGTAPGRLAFSPDNTLLAFVGIMSDQFGAVFVIDVPRMESVRIVEGTRHRIVRCVAWSPDGRNVMLGVVGRGDWNSMDLVVVSVVSGDSVTSSLPHTKTGVQVDGAQVVDGIDWIE